MDAARVTLLSNFLVMIGDRYGLGPTAVWHRKGGV